jgi:MoaA/NifB/PqqE/SkfB family radical SAM enzyme
MDDIIKGSFPNKKCYICRDIVTVDPYGNVMGCLHFNNYVIGNIKSEPLNLIWKGENHSDFIKLQNQKKIDICKFCSNGVGRNYTPLQSIKSLYLEITKKACI